MSLYSALPPTQGQPSSTPAASSASTAPRITPPRLFPPRPSIPSIPRTLLNRPTPIQPTQPTHSNLTAPLPATQPLLPSSTQRLLAGLAELGGGADEDCEDGDGVLVAALASTVDVYQPRLPNEWQQYVEWKERKQAAEAEAEAERSRKRAAQWQDQAEDDEDMQRHKRQQQQHSFNYAYKAPAADDERASSDQRHSGSASAAPPAVVAAPLVDKQAMLTVASGEDAYQRRMRMSTQQTATSQAEANSTSSQPRRPPPPAAALPQISLSLPPLPPPPARASQAAAPPPSAAASRNMVARGEVDSELEDETADECRKFGAVQRCTIVALPEGSGVREEEAVRIFVLFADVEGAKRAVQGLQGRHFGTRRVECVLFDENKFVRGSLT